MKRVFSFVPFVTFALAIILGCSLATRAQEAMAPNGPGSFQEGSAEGHQDVTPVPIPAAQPLPAEEATTKPGEVPIGMTPEAIAARARVDSGTIELLGPPPAILTPPDESGPAALAPFFGGSFLGVGDDGIPPPDPTMAAGPKNLVVMTNGTARIFGKTGTMLQSMGLRQFFGTNQFIFDPWAVYDPYINRFWVLAVTENDNARTSSFLIALSNTNDAMDGFQLFTLDARLNGNVNSDLWCDYPKLGFDAQAIYLTCNMFAFPVTGPFQYAKVRVLTKGQFLAGGPIFWWDFFNANLREGALQLQSFAVQPARMYGAAIGDGEFLIDSHGGGVAGAFLEVRRITNAQRCCIPGMQSAPDLATTSRAVAAYAFPPGARQPFGATGIDTGDTRLLYAFWKGGLLSTGQNTGCQNNPFDPFKTCAGFTELNVAGYPAVGVANNWVLHTPGLDYYYPAVDVNAAGRKTMVYSRSSDNQFAGALFVGIPPSSVCTQCFDGPETVLAAGGNTYVKVDGSGKNRWGDYSGASADPDGAGVWIHEEFAANLANTWSTKVGLTYEALPNPSPRLTSLAPSSALAGGPAFTLTVTGIDFVPGASVVRWNGNNRATVFVNNTQLTATIPASDILTAGVVPITVLTGQPGGGLSNSLPFAIVNPTPDLANVSPASAVVGTPELQLAVNGNNFVSVSVVRWNGSDRPTTFISRTQLTASLPASDLASLGTAQITVFNPAPAGGISNAARFEIRPATVFNGIISVGGLFSSDDRLRHALVAGSNGDLTEIFWNSQPAQGQTVLTNFDPLASSVVGVAGFFSTDDNYRHACVGLNDGNVWEVFYNPQQGLGRSVLANFDPTVSHITGVGGFFSSHDNFRHCIVATDDGNVTEIAFNPQQGQRQTVLTNFDPTVGNIVSIAGFFTSDDNFDHVIVGTDDGNVTEVFYNSQGLGRSVLANFDPAVSHIVGIGGLFSSDDNYRHAIVATDDGNVTEIFFNPQQGQGQTVLTNFDPAVSRIIGIAGFFSNDDNYRHVIVGTDDGKVHEIFYNSQVGIMVRDL